MDRDNESDQEKNMQRRILRLSLPLGLAVMAGSAFAGPDAASGYYQGWDVNSGYLVNGWEANTSLAALAFQASGGATGGYAKASASGAGGTFDIGAKIEWPLNGSYAGSLWTVSVDLRLVSGSFDGIWLRYRYSDSRYNGWVKPLADSFAPGDWFSASATFDPGWTDTAARAHGWVPDNEVLFGDLPPPWATTLSNVYTTEIRFSGTGALVAGIDNFRLSAPPPVPEPETYAMFMAGLGLLGLSRRARSRRR
ncbi:MAG: PEP-CTERM sorting domain-containing protein [Rhodocyclaceae bacterium]|nr:PEP-CTERM sorting domain-containing protein [Rhodocyclaceae bacterium]